MLKSKKMIIWTLAGIGLLLLAVVVLLNTLLTPERIRQTLVPVLEAALERNVAVETIEIGLFSGVTAEKFEIRDPANGELLLTARKAVLKYQFWPLLNKQVVIDRVLLEAPELTLVRRQDGSFNTFSTEPKATQDQAGVAAGDSEPASSTKLDLLVSEIAISNGTLLFVDKKLNPQAPFRYQLKNFTLKASRVALDREFPLEISGELDNSSFRLQGNVNLALPGGSFKLNAEQLDLAAFAPYFRDTLPGIFSRADMSMNLDITVSGDQVAVNGDLTLGGIYLVLDAIKDLPIRDGELALKLDLQADLASSHLSVRPSILRYNQIETQLEGEVHHWDSTAQLNLAVSVDKLKLRDAIASLPTELTSRLNGLDPAGTISLQTRLQGTIDQQPISWIQQATLNLEELQVNVGPIRPSLSGPVTLTGQSLSANGLRLAVGDNQALVGIKLPDIHSRPVRLVTDIHAERLDLDVLLQSEPNADNPPVDGRTDVAVPPKQTQEPGPFEIPVDGEGAVQVKQLKIHGLTADNVELRYQLKNNILTVEGLDAEVGGGIFNQTARIDLGKQGFAYQSELKLEQVPGAQVLAAFAPKLKGVELGSLNLTSSFNGRGTKWEKLSQSLVANGSAQMNSLQLTNAPVVAELAGFLQLNELKEVVFDEAKATFKISQGTADLNSALLGKRVKIAPQGKIGLNGALNLSLPTSLAPEIAAKLGNSQLGNLFVNAQGWVELPIKLKGRVDSPEFKVDSKQIRKQAINKLEDQLLKKHVPKPADGKLADPKEQLLEDALKGLLGR
jgi:AsmA protein